MAEGPKSILVIKPSSFGDVVHTLPAVAVLKQAWPGAQVSWVINPEWSPLLDGNPCVQKTIPFPRGQFRGWRGGGNFLRWCRQSLAPTKPDLAVDFQGLLRSAWMGRASGAECLVGMSDAREGGRWFYDHVIPMPGGVTHAVDRYLATAQGAVRALGQASGVESDAPPTFPLQEGSPLMDADQIPSDYVLLHPYARGEGKSLTQAQVAHVCTQLAPRCVLLVGRRPDTGRVHPSPPRNCTDLLDRTSLAQLIWLLRRAAVVITVDSGPSHLAAALGRPLVAIHTWSDPRRVGPYLGTALVWKNGRLLAMREMAGQDDAFFRQPPRGVDHRALEEIGAAATSLSSSSA